jgi:hypothetical protein
MAAQPAAPRPEETSFGAKRSVQAAPAGLHRKAPASDAGSEIETWPRGIAEYTTPSQKADLIMKPIKASRLQRRRKSDAFRATLSPPLEYGVVKLPLIRANEFTLH